MYRDSKEGITVLTILDTRRQKQRGLYPIKVQVIYKRIQKYYATDKKLSVKDWDRLPETKATELSKVRNSIKNSYDLVLKNMEELANRGDFTFDALNIRLGIATGDTVNNAFKAKIDLLRNEERIGTMMYYDNILKGVKAFAGEKIPFENITVEWLKRYDKFL